MARVTPKTTWGASNVPEGPDFNRIEGNAQQAFDEIDTEVQNRIDDVNAEESRATSAESTLQTNINNEASSRSAGDSAIFAYLTTDGAVGSYGFFASAGSYNHGNTTAGSNLKWTGWNASGITISAESPAGTWKCMGYAPTNAIMCLWVRIS